VSSTPPKLSKARAARPLGAPHLESLDVGIFAISFAILLLELLLTRVFSVVMYHHFSFLAVSLAMMGIALGGLIVNLRPDRFRADNVATVGPRFARMFALSLITAASVAFHFPVRLDAGPLMWFTVVPILAVVVLPFIFGGAIVAHILAFNAERAHRLYFFDLVGAGFGCLLFVPLIGFVGAPSALLLTAAVGTLAGAALADGRGPTLREALLAGLLLLAAGLNTRLEFFDVRFAKGARTAPALATRWNSFSRVEVRGDSSALSVERPPESWGFSSRLQVKARELHLVYDAGALTQIVGFAGNVDAVRYLLWDVTAAAHNVRSNRDVLVIGAGGGRDVLAALAGGSRSVTAVEINGVTVALMRDQFRDYTGGLYVDRPDVRVFVEDGRSFVQRAPERYDLITASLVDTWAASSAGAYALAENSLYTVEAFGNYLARLKPDGIVSFTRWYGDPPVEVFRVVTLARHALRGVGVTAPDRHVAVVRTDQRQTGHPSMATILVKRSPFTDAEMRRLGAWSGDMLFDLPYVPPFTGMRGSEPAFEQLLGTDAQSARFAASARADLSPTTDDRPCFFRPGAALRVAGPTARDPGTGVRRRTASSRELDPPRGPVRDGGGNAPPPRAAAARQIVPAPNAGGGPAPAPEAARVDHVLRLPRPRLHHRRDRADPTLQSLPRESRVRADRGAVHDATRERRRRPRRRALDGGTGAGADPRGGVCDPRPRRASRKPLDPRHYRDADAGEDRAGRGIHGTDRVCHGDAVPERPPARGTDRAVTRVVGVGCKRRDISDGVGARRHRVDGRGLQRLTAGGSVGVRGCVRRRGGAGTRGAGGRFGYGRCRIPPCG
jgi:SAM-dependent methyltransferase